MHFLIKSRAELKLEVEVAVGEDCDHEEGAVKVEEGEGAAGAKERVGCRRWMLLTRRSPRFPPQGFLPYLGHHRPSLASSPYLLLQPPLPDLPSTF